MDLAVMALPAILGLVETIVDSSEVLSLVEPAVSLASSLSSSNPSPSAAESEEPAPLNVLPADAPSDAPRPMSEERPSSAPNRSQFRHEYQPPAILGKQAIAYDPRMRVPAPSFLGHGPTTLLPFSYNIGRLKVPSGSWDTSLTISSSIKAIPELVKLIEPWRFAKVRSLEATCLPTFWAEYLSFQLDAAWTTDAQSNFVKADDMISHLGHTRIVFAGGVTQVTNTSIPAPLGQLNSVLKDSASYNDTPKVHIILTGRKKDDKHDEVVAADIIIRGVLEVGDISLY
uniref:Capsid protein n=1 Tax=Guarapuava tymovirus-like 1 TaxID=2487752 RepID=A0A3G4YIE4_9VIRU|nr:capsid protein [Guarapuava tymovirus-like 1]